MAPMRAGVAVAAEDAAVGTGVMPGAWVAGVTGVEHAATTIVATTRSGKPNPMSRIRRRVIA